MFENKKILSLPFKIDICLIISKNLSVMLSIKNIFLSSNRELLFISLKKLFELEIISS